MISWIFKGSKKGYCESLIHLLLQNICKKIQIPWFNKRIPKYSKIYPHEYLLKNPKSFKLRVIYVQGILPNKHDIYLVATISKPPSLLHICLMKFIKTQIWVVFQIFGFEQFYFLRKWKPNLTILK
jgi:hypothetical protein